MESVGNCSVYKWLNKCSDLLVEIDEELVGSSMCVQFASMLIGQLDLHLNNIRYDSENKRLYMIDAGHTFAAFNPYDDSKIVLSQLLSVWKMNNPNASSEEEKDARKSLCKAVCYVSTDLPPLTEKLKRKFLQVASHDNERSVVDAMKRHNFTKLEISMTKRRFTSFRKKLNNAKIIAEGYCQMLKESDTLFTRENCLMTHPIRCFNAMHN
ncbi:MAG: hypothetical protein LBG86_00865 [Puniceicoccales bacterium]|nr:hypothetical protein [Puniceicoccales bacterium]